MGFLWFGSWDKYELEAMQLKIHFFDEVLVKGLHWIEDDNLEACPLCENKIDLVMLRSRIRERLDENKQLLKLKIEFQQSEALFITYLQKRFTLA